MNDNMKNCTKCGQDKPLDDFHNDKSKKDGKRPNCKLCHNTQIMDAYRVDPSVRLARAKDYYEKHHDEIRAKANASPATLEATRKRRRENPDKVREAARRWADKNKDKVREWHKVQMSRRRAQSGCHSVPEWRALLKQCNHKCVGCGCQPDMLERDHIIPVSQGGSDNISNIQPLCGTCNKRKGVQTINFLHER